MLVQPSKAALDILDGRLDKFVAVERDTDLWTALTSAVNTTDPAGLGGVLDDLPEEYDLEVEDLCRLQQASALDALTAWAVFALWFSEDSIRPAGDPCWATIAAATGQRVDDSTLGRH